MVQRIDTEIGKASQFVRLTVLINLQIGLHILCETFKVKQSNIPPHARPVSAFHEASFT